jgi:predicted RNA-binding protein YlqC (UPF0109 family)
MIKLNNTFPEIVEFMYGNMLEHADKINVSVTENVVNGVMNIDIELSPVEPEAKGLGGQVIGKCNPYGIDLDAIGLARGHLQDIYEEFKDEGDPEARKILKIDTLLNKLARESKIGRNIQAMRPALENIRFNMCKNNKEAVKRVNVNISYNDSDAHK